MDVVDLAAQVAAHFSDAEDNAVDGAVAVPVAGLTLLRHRRRTPLHGTLYEPVICLILQGRKEATLGDTRVSFGAGESLLVSHDVPVTSRITKASPGAPYLAMVLTLDLPLLRGLYDELGDAELRVAPARTLDVAATDPRLVDSLSRYLALAGEPVERKVLGPLILREIHFRLLQAPHGAMLRTLLRHDSHASRIARAIARIRSDFRSPLNVVELALSTGMSPSSFHQHFRDITATTPLQYQKDLRLLEARRLLSTTSQSVSDVAFEIGYQSPSQFSREYARKFGVAPRAHRAAARA